MPESTSDSGGAARTPAPDEPEAEGGAPERDWQAA